MITLIHGEDTTLSRNYYFDMRQKFPDAIILDGATITQTDLQQSLSGQDLFGSTPHIFIEDLLSKRKSSKDTEALVAIINSATADIVLWESKELTSKQLGLFKNATIKVFKIPSTIFAYLDAVRPQNSRQLVELFHKTLEDKEPEFVLFMLTRLIRTLLAMSSRHSEQSEESQSINRYPELDSGSQQISELSRMQPWQKGKVEKQAKLFTTEQLVQLHTSLFNLELGMKTGGLTLTLADSMDLLLLGM